MPIPIINHNIEGVIRIGNITLRQVPDTPELVRMQNLVTGDEYCMSAQALCDVVDQFYQEHF